MSLDGNGKDEGNGKAGESPPSPEDHRDPFTRFDDLAKKVFSVPKEELDRAEREYQKKK